MEPAFVSMAQGRRYQFTRTGYFWQDPVDSTSEHPVFSQIVGLQIPGPRRVQAGTEANPPRVLHRLRFRKSALSRTRNSRKSSDWRVRSFPQECGNTGHSFPCGHPLPGRNAGGRGARRGSRQLGMQRIPPDCERTGGRRLPAYEPGSERWSH